MSKGKSRRCAEEVGYIPGAAPPPNLPCSRQPAFKEFSEAPPQNWNGRIRHIADLEQQSSDYLNENWAVFGLRNRRPRFESCCLSLMHLTVFPLRFRADGWRCPPTTSGPLSIIFVWKIGLAARSREAATETFQYPFAWARVTSADAIKKGACGQGWRGKP